MQQRQSLSFLPPIGIENLTKTGIYALHCYIGQYMLKSGLAETPIMFLNTKQIKEHLDIGYDFAIKLNNDPFENIPQQLQLTTELHALTVQKDSNLTASISELSFLGQACLSIIYFETSHNSIVIVGSKGRFYVIDIVRKFFYETSSPEYDITTYQEQYGSSNFDIKCFTETKIDEKEVTEEKLPTPPLPQTIEIIAVPAPEKKRKIATTTKK